MLLVTGAKNPRIIGEIIMQKNVKISSVYFTIKLGSGRTRLANYHKPLAINAKCPIKIITSNGVKNV